MESNAEILVRQITPADSTGLLELFDQLSVESRRRRFHSAGVRLSETDARRLARVDRQTNDALVATDPGSHRIVGVAPYVALPHDAAAADRFEEVVAYVDPDNELVLDWLGRAWAVASPTDADLYTLALESAERRRAA